MMIRLIVTLVKVVIILCFTSLALISMELNGTIHIGLDWICAVTLVPVMILSIVAIVLSIGGNEDD